MSAIPIALLTELQLKAGISMRAQAASDHTDRKFSEESLPGAGKHLDEVNELRHSSLNEHCRFGRIIGQTRAMQKVYELIRVAAASDANVIITGESGTGKELVARSTHEMSERRSGSFVPVNCSAIPESLMESEFFGYRKGAFTGASIDKHGFLDLADGGTLFLDELGDIGQNMQVKLLRAIDGGGFTPIGCSELKTPDMRIIAATNRNLSELTQKGLIREDFYYRIHVIPIQLPPLRERRDDIPLLVEHFVDKFSKDTSPPPVSPRIMAALQAHDWPGNVRELQNTVFRYLTLQKLEFAGVQTPPARLPAIEPDRFPEAGADLDAMVSQYERHIILKTLERNRWQREITAEALNIHRKTLFTKMKKYGLAGKGTCP
jgi:transcriptional regulator with PAS, ATPase and Fis domain